VTQQNLQIGKIKNKSIKTFKKITKNQTPEIDFCCWEQELRSEGSGFLAFFTNADF
jgi:hypothetical protein